MVPCPVRGGPEVDVCQGRVVRRRARGKDGLGTLVTGTQKEERLDPTPRDDHRPTIEKKR